MTNTTSQFTPQFTRMFSRTPQLSDIKPSEWAEKRIKIPGKGPLSFDDTPYCRKPIDCMAPDHPARIIAIMKGSQIRFSSNVIYPACGYTIAENPCNTLLMVGDADLMKSAAGKLDLMIEKAKLQDHLSHFTKKKVNNKSGDTDYMKTFAGCFLKLAAATDPKAIAQEDYVQMLLDDFDAMEGSSKIAGNLLKLVEMRAANSLYMYKLVLMSTVLSKNGKSNIKDAFLRGNQERYFLHCPECKEPIIIKWNVEEGELINSITGEVAKNPGGILPTIQRDNHDRLIKKSVGYVCYKCAGFFTDRNKQQMLREGIWTPTAIPVNDSYYSFHIPALYAPVGAFDWVKHADNWVQANPTGQPPKHDEIKTIVNTVWGEAYDEPGDSPDAKGIMKNTRPYSIATVPEKMSIDDGNGRVVLITLTADMNGKVIGVNKADCDDARLDYEVAAWTESGSKYSLLHGSIGTFVPLEGQQKEKADRVKWSYQYGQPNCVWPELDRILGTQFVVEDGEGNKRKLGINFAALDTGHYTNLAYTYLDKTNHPVVGVKGDKEEGYTNIETDRRLVKESVERPDKLWILQVNKLKDTLSRNMQLRWDEHTGQEQPGGFMNFPTPGEGLYGLKNFFEHYEAEQRMEVASKSGTGTTFRWVKKSSTHQNHMWDCAVYQLAIKEIWLRILGKAAKNQHYSWQDYVKDYRKAMGG